MDTQRSTTLPPEGGARTPNPWPGRRPFDRVALALVLALSLGLVIGISACSDAGDPAAAVDPATEVDGSAAPAEGGADAGAPGSDAAAEEGAASQAAPPSGPYFQDVAEAVGVDFRHFNGMTGELYFVEVVGSGSALFDYDQDGDLDLYLVQGHLLELGREPDLDDVENFPTDRLYRNDLVPGGQLRFEDVTEESGIRAGGYGMGVTTGDYDRDGDIDLYLTNWGANQLWRNEGDGRFSDASAALDSPAEGWSTSAAFLDYDRDGWLDLYVTNYEHWTMETDKECYGDGRADYCGPKSYLPQPDQLFRNRGDGSFEDVSLATGIAEARGPGLGVVTADFDDDGWIDLYVTNDGEENQLWMNREGRRFEDTALLAGAALNAEGMAEASMGIAADDFDGDGDEDLFMTHLSEETNTLYTNDGGGIFQDASRGSGLGLSSMPFTGFGVASLDIDGDGWLDLVIANGAVLRIDEQFKAGDPLPLRMPNQAFRNTGDGRFEEVTEAAGPALSVSDVGRGISMGDLDNDGDVDVVLTNNNGPVQILRNEVGNASAWLGLRLSGAGGGADALGSVVSLERDDGRVLHRRLRVDGSYCSANDPRLLIGLGEDRAPQRVVVRWPDGSREVWEGLAVGRYHTLTQGDGAPVEPGAGEGGGEG